MFLLILSTLEYLLYVARCDVLYVTDPIYLELSRFEECLRFTERYGLYLDRRYTNIQECWFC